MMKILVCVRSVPLPESSFRVNGAGNFYDQSELNSQVNEYDLFSIEEAVRLKERFKDVEITVVSVGPQRVDLEIKKALAQGADQGARIDDPQGLEKDSLSVASLIAKWASDKKFDLIFCGLMSQDLQRYQTGPMLAQLLSLPCATTIVAMTVSDDRKKIICERELEGGVREKVELLLPALVSVQSGINQPRYASLSNVLKARKIKIPVLPPEPMPGLKPGEKTGRIYLPEKRGKCEFLQGGPEQVAEALLEKIRGKANLFSER